MKKNVIINLLFLFSYTGFAQTEIKYKGTGVYLILEDKKTNTIITKAPRGTNLYLTYDTFFKNWHISWTDENGQNQQSNFKYLRDTDGGTLMKDDSETKYLVMNGIKKGGVLFCQMLTDESELKDKFVYLSFEGIAKVQ